MSNATELPLFPLNTVLFPGMVLPLHIFEDRYQEMINRCLGNNEPFGVVLIREGLEVGGNATVFDIGTTAHITQVNQLGGGRMNIATLGVERFRIREVYDGRASYLIGAVEDFPFNKNDVASIAHEAALLGPLLTRYLDLVAHLSGANVSLDELPDDPSTLAFLTAIVLRAPMEDKQSLLSIEALNDMLEKERRLLSEETQVLELLVKNAPNWRESELPFSPN